MLNRLKDLLTKKVQSLCKLTQKTALLGATKLAKANDQCIMWYSFMKFLLILLHRSIQTLEFSLNLLIYANLRHGV